MVVILCRIIRKESLRNSLIVLLQTLVWLPILAKTITAEVGGSLGVLTTTGAAVGAARRLATLLAGLVGVNLAVGEAVLLDTLVGLAILAETVVF